MELDFAFLASHAEVSDKGKFNVLGGGFNVVESSRFPCRVAGALVMRFVGPTSGAGQEHTAAVAVLSPDGTRKEVILRPTAIKRKADFPTSGLVVVVQLSIDVPAPGDYGLIIALDGNDLKTLPLYLRKESDEG
ncbi:MAG: hypothetical protein WD063_19930 [Pirellulales bacterium]